jgi:hypothetical protein
MNASVRYESPAPPGVGSTDLTFTNTLGLTL